MRKITPHLDQPSTISSNTTISDDDDPEIEELTQEAFITSTRANRRLSHENMTKEVSDWARPEVQKKTRMAEDTGLREASEKDRRNKGKSREVVVKAPMEDKGKEADKEGGEGRDEDQARKGSRELTVVGDGPPPQSQVVNLLPRTEVQGSGSRPNANTVKHPFANV